MEKDHKELPKNVKGYLQKIDDYFEHSPVKGFIQDVDSFFQKRSIFHSFPVDMYETDKEIIVQAELPGVPKEKITIDIQDTFVKITVDNDSTLETKSSEQNIYRKERSTIHSERIIKAPCELIKKQAKASYKNGVLEIIVPKKPYEKQIIDIQ